LSISFIGWYDRANCGDEAFKQVHRTLFPDHDLEWVCDRSPSDHPDAKLVLGGGDVFLDYYLQWIPENTKFWAYGVGLGGEKGCDRVLQHRDRLHGIWLRNPEDVATLNAMGVNAHFTPDIVFNLRGQVSTWKKDQSKPIKRMYVILSNNIYQSALRSGSIRLASYMDYFKHELAMTLNGLAQYYEVVFLPFSLDPNDFDPGICSDVYAIMRKFNRPGGEAAVRVIREPPPPMEVLRLLRDADLVLTMKFHGLIFSTLLGVPFINIGISRKNRLFCADNGLDHLSIEEFAFSKERLEARVKAAEHVRTASLIDKIGEGLYRQAALMAADFHRSLLG